MKKKDSGVSFYSVTKALINNPITSLGLFTAFAFTFAGTVSRVVLEGHYVYVGWGMFIIGVISSIPYFVTITVSAYLGGEKLSKPTSSNETMRADDYLIEAEIYINFGKRKAAINALRQGVEEFPENSTLQNKLFEMENKY